ncbi:hypothetical protein KP806_18110 [Paenibacillus sp. N4]|uniref:DUF6463 family protein n=1 Tax=Paenibacillus vietnamensis TaxID=2590547 RepID=UPI001CD18FB5|nr:DUF6463 family protein [Paenibacillus vietnamensis]MCA0756978.1 hypothetical protein [Paenibacillus vietnamensis]
MHSQKHSGWMLEWTSYIHIAIGILVFWQPLADIFKNGGWNAVAFHYDRAAVFWFIFFGILMWVLGRLMRWLIADKKLVLPKALGWHLTIVATAGAFCLPVSGFWLVILQGIYLIRGASNRTNPRT